jgi:hypothetical protein
LDRLAIDSLNLAVAENQTTARSDRTYPFPRKLSPTTHTVRCISDRFSSE